jgi:hypothetical protein
MCQTDVGRLSRNGPAIFGLCWGGGAGTRSSGYCAMVAWSGPRARRGGAELGAGRWLGARSCLVRSEGGRAGCRSRAARARWQRRGERGAGRASRAGTS